MMDKGLLVPMSFKEWPETDGATLRRIYFSNGLELTELVSEGDPGLAILNDSAQPQDPSSSTDRYVDSVNLGLQAALTELQPQPAVI